MKIFFFFRSIIANYFICRSFIKMTVITYIIDSQMGQLCSQETFDNAWKHLWLSQLRVAKDIQGVKAKDNANHSTMHTSQFLVPQPQQRSIQSKCQWYWVIQPWSVWIYWEGRILPINAKGYLYKYIWFLNKFNLWLNLFNSKPRAVKLNSMQCNDAIDGHLEIIRKMICIYKSACFKGWSP